MSLALNFVCEVEIEWPPKFCFSLEVLQHKSKSFSSFWLLEKLTIVHTTSWHISSALLLGHHRFAWSLLSWTMATMPLASTKGGFGLNSNKDIWHAGYIAGYVVAWTGQYSSEAAGRFPQSLSLLSYLLGSLSCETSVDKHLQSSFQHVDALSLPEEITPLLQALESLSCISHKF